MNPALTYIPRLVIFGLLIVLTLLDWSTASRLRQSQETQSALIETQRRIIETQKRTIQAQEDELVLHRVFDRNPLDIPDRPPAADFLPKPKPPEAP